MEFSILAAKIIGLLYIAAGIAALSGKVDYNKMIEDFEKSSGLTFITGFITLVIGALLVNYHNIWVKNWTVLITIFAWLSLIKGFTLIAFPQVISLAKKIYKNTEAMGAVLMLIGILFGYLGFFA